MKKTLLLTIVCFVLALGVGFSLVTESNEIQVDSQLASSSYQYIDYPAFTAYESDRTNPVFTVNYSGDYLGTEGYVQRYNGNTFTVERFELPSKGTTACVGHVVTRQNGRVVIYRIYFNVR